jgi:hypothetical protein
MGATMGKARRKPTAPIPYFKALELAAKRLGVDDLDYAEKRLRERLKTAEFGRDWFAQAIDPPDANLNGFWQRSLTIDREKNKASFKRASCVGEVGEPSPAFGFEDVTAYGISIAPAVIDTLALDEGRSPGRPSEYDEALIEKTAREYIDTHGLPKGVEGDGGLLEKVTDIVGPNYMPGRTRAIEILAPILKQAKARSAK